MYPNLRIIVLLILPYAAAPELRSLMDSPLTVNRHSRRGDLFQLIIGYVLILAVIWSPRPIQRPLYIVAVVFIAASIWISFDSWSAMGLRRKNFLRSLWVPAIALLLAAIAVMIAIHEHTLHPVGGVSVYVRSFWGYTIWSFAQQLLLQGFFLARLIRLLPTERIATIAAASIFALAHLPNPILTSMTLVWGLIACFVFLRYRNLLPLAIAHATLGICLAITIPGPVIRNMRVGLGYLAYPHRNLHYRSH
jgi:membrane protease YdiL (CAAX protease family)